MTSLSQILLVENFDTGAYYSGRQIILNKRCSGLKTWHTNIEFVKRQVKLKKKKKHKIMRVFS